MKLRVATWNVHRCIGTDRKYDPERVANLLKAIGVDIVALQEVDTSLKGNDEFDQLAVMARITGLEPIYGATRVQAAGHFGNAFLHRHRVLGKRLLNLSYRKYEPRGALSVDFEIEGRKLQFVNTHLGLKAWERTFQITSLLSEIQPFCLLGDFNEWFPYSLNLLRLQRSFQKNPNLYTFPSVWPRFALDRIFLPSDRAATHLEVFDTPLARKASDHLPLVAEFEI